MEAGALIWEKEWTGELRQRRPVFSDLHALIRDGSLDFSRVARVAVGVGPGAFSGLRMAVSLVQGLALPDGKPVMGISSARALAWDTVKDFPSRRVVVWGDARRNELWAGCFTLEAGIVRLTEDWVVTQTDQIPADLMAAGGLWVTADWDRIGPVLERQCPAGVTLIREIRRPRAGMVAQVAEALAARGVEGEPLVPIYIHPAVSVAPRF